MEAVGAVDVRMDVPTVDSGVRGCFDGVPAFPLILRRVADWTTQSPLGSLIRA